MNSIILSIGDELVLGQTVDTNSAWLSQQLSAIGCDVTAHRTVADDRAAIATAIREEAARCDVLIISGGLGPTDDDLTREALADVLEKPLEVSQAWLDHLLAFFQKLGRPMAERNKVQTLVPQGAAILWNHNGTAPGLQAEYFPPLPPGERSPGAEGERGQAGSRRCVIFVMPGVPKEMKPMFTNAVLPWIARKSGGAVILQKTLHTFGMGESTVAEKLGELMKRGRNPSVGTTVSGGVVSLRINARFESLARAEAEMDATCASCRGALPDIIYGEDAQTLPEIVAALMIEKGKTVATAESCSGGLLAKYLTDIAGSSAYFKQGWITYTNDSKVSQLGVKQATLEARGAVSRETVVEMAEGARTRAGADYALSISGVAGPGGGTDAKPVGTVCIGLAHADGVEARQFTFTGDREMIRDRSARMALMMLRYHLLGLTFPA
jgi:nicotinamide-nucleotide amidase